MKKEVPTPNVLLDRTKKRKDGKCPLYISITFNHERAKEATYIRKLTEESDLSRAADAIYSIEQFGF